MSRRRSSVRTRPATTADRSQRWLQIEDLLLAAWAFGAERLVAAMRFSLEPLFEGTVPPGVVVVAVLLAFLIFTRGREDTDLDRAIMRRMLVTGPLFFGLSLYAAIADLIRRARYRLGPDVPPIWPGPLVNPWLRRTAAIPVALVGDAMFRGQSGLVDFSERLDGTAVILAVSEIGLFAFLVAGPRIVAGATTSPWPWLVRFALYAVSAWGGARLFGAEQPS